MYALKEAPVEFARSSRESIPIKRGFRGDAKSAINIYKMSDIRSEE